MWKWIYKWVIIDCSLTDVFQEFVMATDVFQEFVMASSLWQEFVMANKKENQT